MDHLFEKIGTSVQFRDILNKTKDLIPVPMAVPMPDLGWYRRLGWYISAAILCRRAVIAGGRSIARTTSNGAA